MEIQAEQSDQSAYRLARISLIAGIMSIISFAGALLWNLEYGGGLLGMFMGLLLGLLSPIIGIIALRRMRENRRRKILAIIGIILGLPVFVSALLLLIWVLFLAY